MTQNNFRLTQSGISQNHSDSINITVITIGRSQERRVIHNNCTKSNINNKLKTDLYLHINEKTGSCE